MKAFLLMLACTVAILPAPLRATPDYTGFNQAVTNYFAALDAIVKKLPSVDTAAGTAEVINAWSLANEIFADAAEKFAAENPELRKATTPPKEFTDIFARLNQLNKVYPTLPGTVGKLGERFRDDPDVVQALLRFRKSLIRLHISGDLQKNATPAPK